MHRLDEMFYQKPFVNRRYARHFKPIFDNKTPNSVTHRYSTAGTVVISRKRIHRILRPGLKVQERELGGV